MKSSESISNLADALVKANLVITNPTKDRTARAGSYSYRYVGLDTITADLRPILQAHGLCVVQEVANDGVTTRLLHSSGEWLELGPLSLPGGDDAQSRGSATTYARRYSYCAALGIAADEDDDGAKAKSKSKSASGGSGSHAPALPSESPPDAPSSPAPLAGSETAGQEPAGSGGQEAGSSLSPARVVAGDTSSEELSVETTGEATASSSETSPAIGPGRETPPGTDGGTSAIVHQHGSWSLKTPEGGAMRPGWGRCTNLLPNGSVCGYAEKLSRVNASDMLPEEAA